MAPIGTPGTEVLCIPNIGPREQRQRFAAGVVQLTAVIAALAALMASGTDHWWRLALMPLFWGAALGFLQLHWRNDATAGLGVGEEDLLRLTEVRGARRFRGTTGMYHFALLLPNRRELARAIARLFELRYPNHPTDHLMTKTTYLDDPEGNNIEIYTDTPEDGTFGFVDGVFVARQANGEI
jgi:hypothetical protein